MNVLVLSPHPDDESIGLGGTIYQHTQAGDTVQTIFLTSGELGMPGEDAESTGTKREQEALSAAVILGTKRPLFWNGPDGSLGSIVSELALRLSATLVETRPDLIYVPHEFDSHPDHRAAAQALRVCAERSILEPRILLYEVWTPLSDYTEAIDISPEIGIKLLAIRAHDSQVKRVRFDEAALSLARWRGELHNRPHGPYAEVFQRLKL